jgi:hypothetical protein
MRYTYPILTILFMLCIACQSTRLPDAKILRDPSPQLAYRYMHPQKAFSFDFPYYGLRFFKEMDPKAIILTQNLKIQTKQILFYNAEYLSNQNRLMTVLYEKPIQAATLIASNVKRLQNNKRFSGVALTLNPTIKIEPNDHFTLRNYEVKLDSNRILATIKYHAQLDKSNFLCAEYYMELKDQSILRFINFVNLDSTLFDETDQRVDSNWFYKHSGHYNLACFKQPIPALHFTGQIMVPFQLAVTAASNSKKNTYIEPLALLEQSKILYDTLRPEYKNTFYETLMTYYSRAGFNEESCAMRDSALAASNIDSCNSLIIKSLKPENAVDFISRQLPNRRLVMLNEAHHLPICRLFAIQLLDRLKKNGFHYLALETLVRNHKILKNGFPTLDDGFYQAEPMYAELIRQAVIKGFKIIDYDDSRDSIGCLPPPDAHRFYCNNLREENAAERIAQIFKQDSKAKVFVFVGHGHNYKDYQLAQRKRREGHKWEFLAIKLRKKLQIEPFSINQSDMVERSQPDYENPFYHCVRQHMRFEESIVLTQKDGNSWLKPNFETMLDAYVFHPRTGNETPYEWLEKVGFQLHTLDVSDVKDGYLTQVFYKKELEKVGKKAIPALNLPIREARKLELWLRPHTEYVIQIYSKESQLLKEMPLFFMKRDTN